MTDVAGAPRRSGQGPSSVIGHPSSGLRIRTNIVFIALAFVFAGLSFRLFEVQVAAHDTYEAKREKQGIGFSVAECPRKEIHAVHGELLAVSIPVSSIYAVPKLVKDASAISAALGFDVARKLDPKRDFVWLKRRVTDEEAARVAKMPGVGVRKEWVRRYPNGSLAAHLLGITNIDDKGMEGLEKSLEFLLARQTERGEVSVDGLRNKLSTLDVPIEGADVELTVNLTFQRIVEEELDKVVAEKHPKWVAAVAMDPRTGAILALANRPTFDPNLPVTDIKAHMNMVLVAPYEPGSTWKPFCISGALEEGLVTPQTKIDCERGAWRHGSRLLHDHDPYGILTVIEIIAKSSNIGAAKIGALFMGPQLIWKYADAFGFGRATGIELPLEDPGKVVSLGRWSSFTSTSVPMGHEISVTVLQLVDAMSAIANGGRLMRPYVVNRIVAPTGEALWTAKPESMRTVLSPKTSETMRSILMEVVKSGTGTKAAVPGLQVAGKTGTSQKIDPETHQYTHNKFISSFVGFAPADNPRVCIAIVIDEPQGAYYGGAVAAPVFASVVRRGLPHLR